MQMRMDMSLLWQMKVGIEEMGVKWKEEGGREGRGKHKHVNM